MRYLTLFILVVGALLAINHFQESRKSAPKPQKPVVIYRTVPAPRSQADVNLKYLADVAERKEFRRRYKMTYNEECPY